MRLAALSLALGLLLSPIAAQASLIGNTVGCSITGVLFTCSSATAVVVDPGVEFQIGILSNSFFNIDFRSNDVLFTALQPFTLGGTIVNLNDLTNAFTGESLLSFSGISGFSAANISLSMGTLLVDLIGTEGSTGATIDIALANTAVPEPASASLIATGLIALAMVRRRRRAPD